MILFTILSNEVVPMLYARSGIWEIFELTATTSGVQSLDSRKDMIGLVRSLSIFGAAVMMRSTSFACMGAAIFLSGAAVYSNLLRQIKREKREQLSFI